MISFMSTETIPDFEHAMDAAILQRDNDFLMSISLIMHNDKMEITVSPAPETS